MGKILSLLVGAVVVLGGIILLINWWYELLFICRGFIPVFLIIGGVIAILSGLSEIKDTKKMKQGNN